MGPYAPVVSYPTISTLSLPAPTPSLETAASLPSTPPFLTTWTESLSVTGYNVQWPTYWPGTVSGATENLVSRCAAMPGLIAYPGTRIWKAFSTCVTL
jgi:hypothetical protein